MCKPLSRHTFIFLALALLAPWENASSEDLATNPESPATESGAPSDDQPNTEQPSAGSFSQDQADPVAPAEVLPTIATQSASDQDAPGPSTREGPTYLDNIVVTANKRAQSLDQVAGSVGAVRGDQLEKINAKNLEDVLKLIPGVSLNKQEMGGFAPSIRGIATGTTLGISQAATGIYIDDVAFTGPYASFHTIDMNPFDLERVEVLQGPQATLYGTNALAGAIRYILEKPKLDVWEAKGSVDRLSVAEGSAGTRGSEKIRPVSASRI